MTPDEFIKTWTQNDLTEKSGAQSYIEDLCGLLQIDKPRNSEDFCYEKGAIKDGGGQGWADVWKRDCFAWENKKPGRDLKAALAQLREYAGNLGNPPLLIVCDRERIEIHTASKRWGQIQNHESNVGNAHIAKSQKNMLILSTTFSISDLSSCFLGARFRGLLAAKVHQC